MSVDTQGKSLVELMEMLAPAPEPTPISMTPQTWGWAVLAVALVVAFGFALFLYRRHRHANEYRRTALADLERAGDDVAKIAEILRRTALAVYPRQQVAGLYGNDWINFLQQTSGNEYFSESSEILLEAPYRGTIKDPEITKLARSWIKTHKPKGERQ